MKKLIAVLIALIVYSVVTSAQVVATNDTTYYTDAQVTDILRNMPNVEVGKGVTFKSKDNRYSITLPPRCTLCP